MSERALKDVGVTLTPLEEVVASDVIISYGDVEDYTAAMTDIHGVSASYLYGCIIRAKQSKAFSVIWLRDEQGVFDSIVSKLDAEGVQPAYISDYGRPDVLREESEVEVQNTETISESRKEAILHILADIDLAKLTKNAANFPCNLTSVNVTYADLLALVQGMN